MKKSQVSSNILTIIVCILTMVIVLAGCAQPTNPPAPPTTSTGPKLGGTLKIGLTAGPVSLDSFVLAAGALPVLKTFGQTPVRWAGKNDREATVAPLLAKSWEISPDGLTYTFHLQEGVKFQNIPPVNGREITADDWAYHFNRFKDPANKNALRVTFDIKNVEVVDKYTFKITTNLKSPGFLAYMAHGSSIPYPKEVVEAPGGADKNWVGTGAFILTDYVKDSKAVFKKSPDYWEKGKPYLDSVEFYFIPDAAAQLAAFRAGQIDVLPLQGKVNRDAIEKSVPGAQIQEGVSTLDVGLNLNNDRKPFDNKVVRQAMQYAIDYDGLIKAALDGAGMRTGYLAPWFGEWGGKQAADLPKRDVAKAKEMLAQAGYPDGFKTTIMMNTGTSDAATEPLVAMLKDVGIQASIVPLDNPTFISKLRTFDYDMALSTLLAGRPYDVNNSLQQQWPTKSSSNFINYSNPKIDDLVKAQQAAFPDKEKRIPIVKQILSILEDDVPSIPLYITTNYFIKQPWVKGWDDMADPHSAYATQALPYVWLDKQ